MILVGLPGAGKSAVGRAVAALLGTKVTDVDEEIVRRAGGRSIGQLFTEPGEAAFRVLEREAVGQALATLPRVVVPGGGWAAQPGNLASADGIALVVYLKVSPETAAGRLGEDRSRPLLGDQPLQQLRRLLAEREPSYGRAAYAVATDGQTVERVAAEVVALARRFGGW